MAITTFTVRQFFNIPFEELPLGEIPEGTFIVTGSASNLLINNNRTDLANDSIPGIGNSGTSNGWWPGPSTSIYGIIVGGNESFTNTGAGSVATSFVSCWGWDTGETQGANDVLFISLANNILGTEFVYPGELDETKDALKNAGYYYQYPVGFDGQSPNTGDGSDR
jgi:hypothetical protein